MLIPARTGGAPLAPTDSVALTTSIPAEVWIVAAMTGVAALVRFAMLGSQSYGVDEVQAAREVHMSFGAMLSAIGSGEPNPPLYFVLGWVWAKVFGVSEAGLRSLSALLGCAVIPVTYLCGRELVSKRAGLAAAALACLSPFLIWYSQEAREYMLLAVLTGLSVLFFARGWRAPTRRNLTWWAAFSALAILTQYFAIFLVAPEAVALLYRARSRASAVAVAVVAAAQVAVMPHFLGHADHPYEWIGTLPLAIRIKQVPVAFGLGTLYQSGAVNYGLIAAAVLLGLIIVLLVVWSGTRQLRGAGLAGGLAACVLLLPLLLAVLGRDYYIARALMPAWIPLAVVVGAACTIPRSRSPVAAYTGGGLLLVLLGAFVYAQIRIDTHWQYQRPDWRGVAAALGASSGQRAIVAYDGGYAAEPLTYYLPGVLRDQPAGATTVREIDVVGSAWQRVPGTLPPGVRLIGRKSLNGYQAARFALATPWRATPTQLAARSGSLLAPGESGAWTLIQRPAA
jgi:hypothetical protein